MSSTDQRHLVINFRFPLDQHKVVTYTALVVRSIVYLVHKYIRREREKGNSIPYKGWRFSNNVNPRFLL